MKTDLTTMALTTWVKSIDANNNESKARRDANYEIKKLKVNQLEKIIDKKKQNEDLIYRCDQWYISRSQRDREIKDGLGLKGTMGYQNMGCYNNCQGYKQQCPGYSNILKIKLIDDIA